MSKKLILAALVGVAMVQPAVAQPAPSTTKVTAWLGRTVAPSSTEKMSFYVWNAGSFEVKEYRVPDAQLEASLRDSAVSIDTTLLTPTRTKTFQGMQGEMNVATGSGVYVYVAKATVSTGPQNMTNAQGLVVTRLGLGVKRDDASSFAFVHAANGTSVVPNATVKVYETNPGTDTAPTLVRTGISAQTGIASFVTPAKGTLVYIARSGSDIAIQQTWDRSWSQQQTWLAHVQTDRPLYRPGQTVNYRAILRETLSASSSYRTPVNADVRVFLRDSKGSRTSLGTLKTNAFGTVSGSVALSPSQALGEHQVEFEAGPVPAGSQPYPIGTASFGVQEYRKPEFKVTVTSDKASYVQGQIVSATIKADYYFGAPVPNAKVHYTVTKTPRFRWWNPWLEPMIMRCWFPPYLPPTVVSQGDVKTAQDGTVKVTFATQRGDQDADYTVEAKVTDASDREIAGSGNLAVTRAAFDLQLGTDRYVYQPNDYIRIRANCATTDGAAQAGQSVRLKIESISNAGVKTLKVDRTVTTDLAGSAGLTLLARTKNQYLVTATAKDTAGNEVSSTRTIYIHDTQGGVDWTFNAAEIIPDKDVYAAGDIAYLLIKAPVRRGQGVLTLESSSIKTRVPFAIFFGFGFVPVRITSSMSPNIFASVMIPTANGLATAEKELACPPVDDVIDVTVTADKSEYRPGDKATFKLVALDRRGMPVKADIALGIVDEALFGLREDQTPRLVDTFYPKLWNNVTTVGGQGGGGPILFKSGPMRTFAMEAAKAANAGNGAKVREYFPDTLKWFASVQTDARGEATLTTTMADNLTTWRLDARAVTADTMVGETRTTTLVRKDLIVRLAAPRTFVEGDELTLVGIVHNLAKKGTPNSEPASVQVNLQTKGLTLLDAASRTITVGREDLTRVTWRLRVDTASQAELTASATAGFDQDALRIKLPIAARGVAVRNVAAGSLLQDGSVTHTLQKDPKAIDPMTELRITLNPSLAGCTLESLDYLVGYPYGCVEQTMSKFFPNLIVNDVLKTLGRQDSTLALQIPDMVKAGVEHLQGMQGADGGFGWWAGNEGHPFVSAYVCYGLGLARQQGFSVPQDMMDRLTRFLESNLDKQDDNGRAYQLFALAMAGKVRSADLYNLGIRRGMINDYSKAVVALGLMKAGNTSLAKDVIATLNTTAIKTSGRAHWEAKTLSYGNWQGNAVETTAYALQAYLAIDPQNPLVADTVSWLVERRRDGGQYSTTKDTAAVVLALAQHVKQTNELDPDLNVTVTINGVAQQHRFTTVDLGKRGKEITVAGSALRVGANTITFARQGRGALYYNAIVDQKVRMDPILAQDNGIKLTREFFKVTRSVDANGAVVEDVKPFVGTAKIGETVRVKISMSVSRPADVEHVNLEDRFPVGFSVVEEQPSSWWGGIWWGGYSAREVHDDRVVFFATHLALQNPNGGVSYEYQYDLRAEVAGKFMALPTFAEAVYGPETNGRSDAKVITVDAN